MKRKIFTLIAVICVASFAFADVPHVNLKKTEVKPVINGALDPIWGQVDPVAIELVFPGESPTINEAWWKACWDDDGIFVVIYVDDDVHFPAWKTGSEENWLFDKPEVYFDVTDFPATREGESGGGRANLAVDGRYQHSPGFAEESYGELLTDENNGILTAYELVNEGYIFEHFFPFSFFEEYDDFDATAIIGFEITVIDRDGEDGEGVMGARQRLMWSNHSENNETWDSMADCGTISLTQVPITVSASQNVISSFDLAVIVRADVLDIRSESMLQSVSLFDVSGRLVASQRVNSQNVELGISSLANGMYIVRATDTKGSVVSKKFVK